MTATRPPAIGTGAAVQELVRVSARYDAARGEALVDASLTVASGEIVAILGPNGAGKSTLLRVLAGTLLPARGEARLFGATLAGRPRREVAREVAFVAQSEEVAFAFTVREVVMMGRAPHQLGALRPSKADERIVDEALLKCDLHELEGRPVDQLSGGERKRAAVARAFAQRARIMLLDEPTAFLDVRHQVALFAQLQAHVQTDGHACVVVTHDLQLAAAHATRVVLMKEGRLLAEGGVDDVLTAHWLAAAFECPIDVGRLVGTTDRVFVPRAASSRAPEPNDEPRKP